MYRAAAPQTIKNQFTGKTGYAAAQSAAESTEFLTKGLADTLYTAAGVTQGITQAQADARYIQLTPVADVNFNGKRITNIINGSASGDVMTKGYIDGADSVL